MDNFNSPGCRHHTLKKWIVLLLGTSCAAAFILYVSYSPEENRQIGSAAEIDSLIQQTFDRFNISDSQIRDRTIEIDSITSRRVYTVDVPPGFSKTQWHHELNKNIRPYKINTPARVIFPDQDIKIHLNNGINTIRTIHLQLNDELVLYRDFASLILAFDRIPSESILNQLRSFGEPVQIAIRSSEPRTDFDRIRNFRRSYPHTVWWLKKSNGSHYGDLSEMDQYLTRLELLNQLDSGARVLFLNPYKEVSDTFEQRMSRMNLLLVDISESLTIDDLSDRRKVEEVKHQLTARSSLYWPPAVIVEGTNSNIRELQEFITMLKQDHVQIRSPYFMEF